MILDGASCHLDISIVDAAENFEISLYCLPSDTTHELQPLDKAVFRAFEHYWDSELLRYWKDNLTSLRSIKKENFGKILNPLWKQCMSISIIQSGFRATGTFPFDPSVIPETAFAPSEFTFQEINHPHQEIEDDS